MFGWPDPNTGFDQSEHALYTCYFIINKQGTLPGDIRDFKIDVYSKPLTASNRNLKSTVSCSKLGQLVH